ncbi:hypothetical protein SO802_029696 [Lithocarpus litseifolius]|uniref:Peptidase M3A/M3B catalytic domain-containing protein n=1 Tax=Lithocarpus litseifolius TaxID=425828 RepID=A0AAW2BUD6_9ROSI
MTGIFGRIRVMSCDRLPIAFLVYNLTPPVGRKPSLLSFKEVVTVFHEFGHSLQHMLTKQDESLVAGIQGIELDAAEFSSQFMEKWCYHKNIFKGIAKHYEIGKSLHEFSCFNFLDTYSLLGSIERLNQIRFAMVDLELHSNYVPGGSESIFDFYRRVSKGTHVVPLLPGDRSLCSCLHIFEGSYAAGYYSYKWSEVMSADAFSAFEEAGLNQEEDEIMKGAMKAMGPKFRDTILDLGGGKAPKEVSPIDEHTTSLLVEAESQPRQQQ